jgi:hypothetical protein
MGLYTHGLNILQHPPAVWTTGAAVFKTGQEESTNSVQRANTPPQPQLATGYVEAGSKLREGRGVFASMGLYRGLYGPLYTWAQYTPTVSLL